MCVCLCYYETILVPLAFTSLVLTTICVDAAVVQESNPEVVQDGRLVQEAESCEIIFTLQDVRVPQRWQIRGRVQWVMNLLSMEKSEAATFL